jgi:predicted PurR-regulated permease PerM
MESVNRPGERTVVEDADGRRIPARGSLMGSDLGHFTRRMLIGAAILLGLVLVLAFLRLAVDMLLIAFAGLLVGVLLRALTGLISNNTPIPDKWAFTIVVLALLATIAGFGWLFASDIAQEMEQFRQVIPASIQQLERWVGQFSWAETVLEQAPEPEELLAGELDVVGPVTGFFSGAVTGLTYGILILFVGFYLAVNPGLYVGGLVRLGGGTRRERARELFSEIEITLKRWLLGQLFMMILIGTISTVGLWLLGMPLFLTLGLIIGLLEFVPYVGPFLGIIPALLVALTAGPQMVLYVLLFWVVLQSLESYVFTPLVHKRAVELPPALTIVAQVTMGVLFGFLGLIVATPLIAISMVMVKMLYVEDVLGEPVELRTGG